MDTTETTTTRPSTAPGASTEPNRTTPVGSPSPSHGISMVGGPPIRLSPNLLIEPSPTSLRTAIARATTSRPPSLSLAEVLTDRSSTSLYQRTDLGNVRGSPRASNTDLGSTIYRREMAAVVSNIFVFYKEASYYH